MALVAEGDGYVTVPLGDGVQDVLQPVFRDGELLQQVSFSQVRDRAHDAAVRLAAV